MLQVTITQKCDLCHEEWTTVWPQAQTDDPSLLVPLHKCPPPSPPLEVLTWEDAMHLLIHQKAELWYGTEETPRVTKYRWKDSNFEFFDSYGRMWVPGGPSVVNTIFSWRLEV